MSRLTISNDVWEAAEQTRNMLLDAAARRNMAAQGAAQ